MSMHASFAHARINTRNSSRRPCQRAHLNISHHTPFESTEHLRRLAHHLRRHRPAEDRRRVRAVHVHRRGATLKYKDRLLCAPCRMDVVDTQILERHGPVPFTLPRYLSCIFQSAKKIPEFNSSRRLTRLFLTLSVVIQPAPLLLGCSVHTHN